MSQLHTVSGQNQSSVLLFLICSVMAGSLVGTPRLGATIALAGLFGALFLLWQSGAVRLRFLLLFAGALATAATIGRMIVQAQ